MQGVSKRILDNMKTVIMGKDDILEYIMVALLSEGHILLEGMPGVGKTKLALALSKSVEGKFKRVQFTPDVLPSDITGFSIYNKKIGDFEYREGAALCNFLLADEINRASPRVQSSLLEAMEERQVSVEGNSMKLPYPFMVLATQNNIDYQGTFPLPEAQLDRFFMKLYMDYPSRGEWKTILDTYESDDPAKALKSVASLTDIQNLMQETKEVVVSDAIKEYILDLITEIAHNDAVEVGINPRGSIALIKAAKAWARLCERDYVIPDDVQKVAVPVLNHRLKLSMGSTNSHKANKVITDAIHAIRIEL